MSSPGPPATPTPSSTSLAAPKSKNAKTRERQKKKKQHMRSLLAAATNTNTNSSDHDHNRPQHTNTNTNAPFIHDMKSGFTQGQNNSRDSEIASLMEEAEQLLIQCDAEQACQLLKQVLTLSARHTPALDLLAQALLDSGSPDGPAQAYACLQQSCQWAPRDHPAKWMLLGQMQEGRAAVQSFNQGIKYMTEEMKMLQGQKDVSSEVCALRASISSAYCSIAELYETDLCDEEEAESECERVLAQAQQVAPDHGEPYAALANLRMIQSRDEEALAALEQFMNIYTQKQSDDERMQYEVRVNVSKMLLELGQHQIAVELLEDLLEEDDRIVEVNHLCAVCYFHLKQYTNALEYTQQALLTLEKSGERNPGLQRTLETLLRNCQQGQQQTPQEQEQEQDDEDHEDEDEKAHVDCDADGDDAMHEH